jgi:type I restriction enzyme R subunit
MVLPKCWTTTAPWTVDLSKDQLTHHALRNQGRRDLPLGVKYDEGDWRLKPLTETGTGEMREKEKALLAEIIAAVNELFEGELTDDDKLVYVNTVLRGKLLESEILVQQATNNTKEQFASSPDLDQEVLNAIMDALAAHTAMSKQALDSERVRQGLKDILLGPGQLYEALRSQLGEPPSA